MGVGGLGGDGVKRQVPSLGPPFVINISFCHLELFCLVLRVKCAIFKLHLQFFLIQEYRIAAILKKWRPFSDLRWLTCFFDKCFLPNFMLASQTERFLR